VCFAGRLIIRHGLSWLKEYMLCGWVHQSMSTIREERFPAAIELLRVNFFAKRQEVALSYMVSARPG
jgi:hypothetical protein